MVYLLAGYGLAASVLLIWMSAKHKTAFSEERASQTLMYEGISPEFLNVWRICCPSLIVIDLRSRDVFKTEPGLEDAISVARPELTRILLWLPPESKLVVYDEFDLKPFDTATELILWGFGVRTIYFLRGGLACWKHLNAPTRRSAV